MRSVSRLVAAVAMALSLGLLVAADQWTKSLAATHLAGRGPVRLLGDFAVLIFASNRGAFLSLGSALPRPLRSLFLIILPAAALLFILWAFLTPGQGLRSGRRLGLRDRAVLVLIAAGGIGNLTDRILYGQVRDFLNFGIGTLRTGIMNLADLYILAALVVAVVAIASGWWRGRGA